MTAFFIDLSARSERALIASDTLAYTVAGGEHAAIGFSSKVIGVPHLRGALIGAGIYEIQVATAAALMLRPGLVEFDDVIEALPAILRAATEDVAEERGIDDPAALMLFAAGWCGWNRRERKFELVIFENYTDGYAAQRGENADLISIPSVPPAYVPPGFAQLASPEVRAMAGLRSIRKFTDDHGALFGAAPIGGEIVLSEISRAGVSTRVVGRFDDYAQSLDEAEETWANVAGDPAAYAGFELVNPTSAQAVARAEFEKLAVGEAQPGMSRQQRRAAAKLARKATKRRVA
jgi:hypothetical protein